VIRRAKPAYHSICFGAFAATHCSIKSKSSRRLKEAIPTIKTLTPIPRGPLLWSIGTSNQPVRLQKILIR